MRRGAVTRRLRIILALIGGGLAAIVLLPWVHGLMLEAAIARSFDRLPETLRPLSVTIQRGWFSSRVESLHPLPGLTARLSLVQEFTHGPVLLAGFVSSSPVIGLASWKSRTELEAPGSPLPEPLGVGRGWVGHDGAFAHLWLGRRRGGGYGAEPDWLQVEGDALGRRVLQGRIAQLDTRESDGRWKVKDWKLRTVLSGAGERMRLEELAWSFGTLEWRGRLGRLSGRDVRLRYTLAGDGAAAHFDLSAFRLGTGGMPWGPGRLSLQATGFDPPAVTAWLSGEAAPWQRVLAGARFRLSELTVLGLDGSLRGTADLTVVDRASRSVPPTLGWVANVDGQARFEIPSAWLRTELERVTRKRMRLDAAARDDIVHDALQREEIDERAALQIARRLMLFVQQGYLTPVPGAYRTAWAFDDGHVRINGKPVNLEQFVRK